MAEDLQQDAVPGGAFAIEMELRWGDMDLLNHVNNVSYFRYFEEARVRLFAAMAANGSDVRYGVLAHASCDFHQPIVYPGRIAVRLRCLRIGRTSLEVGCQIVAADEPQRVYASGRNIMVRADASARPQPWTPADRLALAACFV